MAKIRRVAHDDEPSTVHYFDDQRWPVAVALIVLGGFLMGVSLAYLPLSEVVWYHTAWPSLIAIPVIVIGSIVAAACIDNRLFRRSLQLSLVLCAIIHAGMVLQMLRTQVTVDVYQPDRSHAAIIERRPPKIVPDYHPTQLVSDEDRPRQDYEKPVEAESPAPSPQPERIVRQPAEEPTSPPEPQPVPVPEQHRTFEPNVVNRPVPNEAAPRLAAQTSRLSRQLQPSQSRQSRPVALPAAAPQLAAAAEARPATAAVERQRSQTITTAGARTEPTAVTHTSESQLVRRTAEAAPTAEAAAAATWRRAVSEAAMPESQAVTVESRLATQFSGGPEVGPSQADGAPLPEVTASDGARMTRGRSDARRGTMAASRGAGEIDFGPTLIPGQAASERPSGGGQPEVNLHGTVSAPLRRVSGGGPESAIDVRAGNEVALPPGAMVGESRLEAAPAATTAARSANVAGEVNNRPAGASRAPTEGVLAAAIGNPHVGRASAPEGVPTTQPAARNDTLVASGDGRRVASAATGGTTNVAEIPEVGPRSAVAQADSDHRMPGAGRTTIRRSAGTGLAVDIAAPDGPGGLGSNFTPEVGINTRQARADSINVELRASRFARSQVGGLPAVSTGAVIPTEAYSSRAARVRGQERAGGSGSPSPETEEAIERGLAFLARYQRANGGWSLQGFPEGASLVSDTAATALAVLAFQGAGYNHREFQYRDVVRGGLGYLIKGQKENGDLFVPLDDASNKSVWLYSHSLAAIAICEAYGMTQDPALREPAQKAIDFIVDGQNQQRGGWRYAPGVGADTSVTGWMMMALKSAELAGLDVPPASYRRIGRWLDDAQQSRSEPHLYRYNPYAPDTPEQRHGRAASKTMTAVGLLMRLYTGWHRDNPNMLRGAAFLVENLPAQGTTREPQRDTYYWYYATQVMANVGGESWQAWMGRLHPLLVNSQVRQGPFEGSWDPRAPVADRWGAHAGRLYVTTMNLLSLEVHYRKLPLYDDVTR